VPARRGESGALEVVRVVAEPKRLDRGRVELGLGSERQAQIATGNTGGSGPGLEPIAAAGLAGIRLGCNGLGEQRWPLTITHGSPVRRLEAAFRAAAPGRAPCPDWRAADDAGGHGPDPDNATTSTALTNRCVSSTVCSGPSTITIGGKATGSDLYGLEIPRLDG
jgi:hypothetical protein